MCGFSLGSFIFNFVSGYLVNPENSKPYLVIVNGEQQRYFEEPVASNVPFMLKILAICYSVISAIGVLLIENFKIKEDKNTNSVKLKKAFKTIQFYQLLIGASLTITSGLFVNASFKTIGLMHSISDKFLIFVGSVGSVSSSFSKIFWGYLFDKISYKKTYGIMVSIQIALCFTFPYVWEYKYLLGLWVLLLLFCYGGHFSLLGPICVKLYGKKIGFKMYTAVILSLALASLIVYLIQSLFLSYLGYNNMFTVISLLSFCSLVSTMFFSESFRTSSKEIPLL